jgi:hypothetical protein
MPAAAKAETTTMNEDGTSPVPGKPVSQVEAEAPPDAETAAAWDAEYASRMPDGQAGTAPEEDTAKDDTAKGDRPARSARSE